MSEDLNELLIIYIYGFMVSVWVYFDAQVHDRNKWSWTIGSLILPQILPIWYWWKTREILSFLKCIGLWLLGFLVIYAVGTVMLNVQTANVPKSSNQAARWKTFVSDDKAFTVHFPTEPNRESDIVNAPSGKVELIQYISKHKDILYAVMYGDYTSNAFVGMTSEQLLDNGRDGAVENVQGKLLSEVIISKANYPGREITIKVEPNLVLTAQIILKENRLYQLMVVTPSDKLFTSQRREFFNSFEILDK